MEERPWCIVFAGVNGSGKSTLYRTGLWRTASMPLHMARVNPDEILRAQGGDWSRTSDQIAAGKEALRTLDDHLKHGRSFNYETTLTGHRSLRTIIKARERGYRVLMLYVGVDSAKTAIARIKHRVEVGGHDIDEEIVRRRYRTSLVNFHKALEYCDEAQVFDNTLAFTCIALWSRGVLSWWGASSQIGSWLPDILLDNAF